MRDQPLNATLGHEDALLFAERSLLHSLAVGQLAEAADLNRKNGVVRLTDILHLAKRLRACTGCL